MALLLGSTSLGMGLAVPLLVLGTFLAGVALDSFPLIAAAVWLFLPTLFLAPVLVVTGAVLVALHFSRRGRSPA